MISSKALQRPVKKPILRKDIKTPKRPVLKIRASKSLSELTILELL